MFKLFILNIDMYIYDGLWFIISIFIYFFIYYVDNISFELLYLIIDLK